MEVLREFLLSLNEFGDQLEKTTFKQNKFNDKVDELQRKNKSLNAAKGRLAAKNKTQKEEYEKTIKELKEKNPKTNKPTKESKPKTGATKKDDEALHLKLYQAQAKLRIHDTTFYGVYFDDCGFRISVARGFDMPKPVPIPDDALDKLHGIYTLPSAIYFSDSEEKVVVGKRALAEKQEGGVGTLIDHIENQLETDAANPIISWSENQLDKIDTLAIILRYLKKCADSELRIPRGRVAQASRLINRQELIVLSCPEDWSYQQRICLYQAAKIAGLSTGGPDHYRIINNRMAMSLRWCFINRTTQSSIRFFVIMTYKSRIDCSLMQYNVLESGESEIVTLATRSETRKDAQIFKRIIRDVLKETKTKNADIATALLGGSNIDKEFFEEMFRNTFNEFFQIISISAEEISQGTLLFQQVGSCSFANTAQDKNDWGFISPGRDIMSRYLCLGLGLRKVDTKEIIEKKLYDIIKVGDQESTEHFSIDVPFSPSPKDELFLEMFESKLFNSDSGDFQVLKNEYQSSNLSVLNENDYFRQFAKVDIPEFENQIGKISQIRTRRSNFMYSFYIQRQSLAEQNIQPGYASEFKKPASLTEAREKLDSIEIEA